MVGKYTDLHDAYKSVQEALIHGGIANDVGVDIDWIVERPASPTRRAAAELLGGLRRAARCPAASACAASRAWSKPIRWARENDLPFFGICLGLQVAIIEFARNVCELADTNSTEFEPECDDAGHRADGVAARRDRHGRHHAARRLPGAAPRRARARPQAYGAAEISERHRHRWEVSNAYRDVLAEHGLRLSAASRPTAGWSR